MFSRGQLGPLARPGLLRDFRDSYDDVPVEYTEYLRTGTLDRAERERAAISNLPRHPRVGDLERTPLADPIVEPKRVYPALEYKGGYAISRNAREDDLYNVASQNSKWVGRSVRLTQEFESAALIDDAFTGAEFTGLRGERLIHTAHTFIGAAGTWTNQLAGNPQLAVAGMQAAWELSILLTDHLNNPIASNFSKLLVKKTDVPVAMQITMNTMEPFTSDNNLNDNRERGALSFSALRYASQANRNWFFMDMDNNDAWFDMRSAPTFQDYDDEPSGATVFEARQRFLIYFFDQRGWIGSATA